MDITTITNARIYLNGTNDLLGKASEISLPKVKTKMTDHRPLGMIGAVRLPTGLEAIEMSLKWDSFYPEALPWRLNPWQTSALMIRASAETYGQAGRIEERGVTIITTVVWTESGLGTLKAGDNISGMDDTLLCTKVAMEVGGIPYLLIDVWNNIHEVMGEQVLGSLRGTFG